MAFSISPARVVEHKTKIHASIHVENQTSSDTHQKLHTHSRQKVLICGCRGIGAVLFPGCNSLGQTTIKPINVDINMRDVN